MAASADIRAAATSVMPDVDSIQVEPLPGGSSAFVARLVLTSPHGVRRRVVFRQHADRAAKDHTGLVAAKEFHLTRQLAAEGLEVAPPLALHGEPTSGGPWLVSEWVEGSTSVDPADVDSALSQMARFLARLHAVDPVSTIAPGLTPIEDPVAALPRYLPDDETGHELQRALGLGVPRRPNADVVLHGDFWPGNVLFERNELVAVLDWEDAALGDPLVDLAGARVELTCAYGHHAAERFTSRYLDTVRRRAVPLLTHDLALWDAYVSTTALSAMHRWGLSPDEEAARRDATTQFLGSATKVLVMRSRQGLHRGPEGALDPVRRPREE